MKLIMTAMIFLGTMLSTKAFGADALVPAADCSLTCTNFYPDPNNPNWFGDPGNLFLTTECRSTTIVWHNTCPTNTRCSLDNSSSVWLAAGYCLFFFGPGVLNDDLCYGVPSQFASGTCEPINPPPAP